MNIFIRRFAFPPRQLPALTLAAILLWLGAALAPVAAAPSGDSQPLWLVSTRDAACDLAADGNAKSDRLTANLCYWRLHDGDWVASSAREFHAEDVQHIPTAVFIHGNNATADTAAQNGTYAYCTVRQAVGDRPFRFVIWSWPSDRVLRSRRADILQKAAYSDRESQRLALWLNELPAREKICLIGHSFGPRMIADCLQLLAGGEVADCRLPKNVTDAWTSGHRNAIRAVLLAPAVDEATFASGGRHELALSLVDQAAVTVNRRDCALWLYPLLEGHGGPMAAGRVGPCVDENAAAKVEVIDVRCTVGKTHDCQRYCSASNLSDLWAKYLFLDEPSEKEK
jgi:esterase/lipase superfamily enzyme